MRKRSDAAKAPATPRSITRNSTAARRGEERSVAAGKEHNKTPSTVSKSGEEKGSEPGTPRRSSSKKESAVALESSKSKTIASLSKHANVAESLETEVEGASIEEPERQAASTETSVEGREKQVFLVEALSPSKEAAMSTENRVEQAAVTQTCKEGFEQAAYVGKANLGTEALQAAPLLAVMEEEKSRDLQTGQEDVSEAADSTLLECGKPEKSEEGHHVVLEAGQSNGLDGKTKEGTPDLLGTGKFNVLEANEADESGTGKLDIKEAKNEVRVAYLPESSIVVTESSVMDSAPPPSMDIATKEHESAPQEHESASETAYPSVGEPLPDAAADRSMPPTELPVTSADEQQIGVVEAKHAELMVAIKPLPPGTEEHTLPFVESNIIALGPVPTQQAHPVVTKAETNESFQGIAAASNTLADRPFVARGGEASYASPAVEVYKMTSKASNSHIEASSFLQADSSFNNNMVSSVEGETVLIVENLSLSSQVPTKVEEILSEVANLDEVDTENAVLEAGMSLVGRKVHKRFGKELFEGEVVEHEPELNWYKVVYEDGDEEELDLKEVRRLLAQAEEDELSDRKPHRRASGGTSSSLKRNVGKARRPRSPAVLDDAMEEESQSRERMQFRDLRKRHVIDTSNDRNAESLDSTDQFSSSSDESSEDDEDDDDELVMGKRRSNKKQKRKPPAQRKRKSLGKSEDDKNVGATQARLSSRLKEESVVKSQETSTEHRVATRRATGALSTHLTSSDDHSLSSHRKAHTDSQDKSSSEVHSPLGGGAKLVGRKTKKDFGGQFYFGKIVHYDNRVKYYKVQYEDGDEEELEWSELAPTLLPPEGDRNLRTVQTSHEATNKNSQAPVKDPKRASTTKGKEEMTVLHDGGEYKNEDLTSPIRNRRKRVRTASVSVMMKGTDNVASTSAATASEPPPRALAAVRFASASDADAFEFFGWGEAVSFDRSKCPDLRATRLLPTSSPVVHIAASRHHLVALTAAGQVWVWRCKHGNIRTRCNEWEHVAALDDRKVILVDISGPDVDRASAGYQPHQEDQVPDPFYVAAVCSNGEDVILQGSQPHESVHTYQYDDETHHPGLREAVLQSNPHWLETMGRIVQVSVGMVEAADESPFVGYVTDTDCVFIRSATRDFMEEVNLVTGYTGRPVKIQCGRVYHAILLTDDGRAWTWGQGYYPGSSTHSAAFASKCVSAFSVCQPAVGTLVGRKVVDVGCYGEDFIALTNDGHVHQWTHALPNPAAGVYNVPATPVYGQGPSIGTGDKLKHVTIGAGICAGISESGKVHTWRTSLRGGFAGTLGPEREGMTPLGRDEGTETAILALGTRFATKVMCVAGSLVVVVKRKSRRRGGKRKLDASDPKGKSPEDEADGDG